MSILAVIPARLGSDRMPRKNLCDIQQGMTLVDHAIYCAWASGVVDNIVVSTDEDIYFPRAATVLRPYEMSGPNADIRHAVQHAARARATRHDYVMTLQPAVLARSPLIIRRLVKFMEDNNCSGGLTMASTHRWIWQLGNSPANDWHPGPYPRSQDSAPRAVEINAVQVATWADAVEAEEPKRWGLPMAVALLPPWAAALDIDTPQDLAMARDLWPWAKTRLETCVPEMHLVHSINGGG